MQRRESKGELSIFLTPKKHPEPSNVSSGRGSKARKFRTYQLSNRVTLFHPETPYCQTTMRKIADFTQGFGCRTFYEY